MSLTVSAPARALPRQAVPIARETARASTRSISGTLALILVLAITGIAATLRLWHSTWQSLRLDEGFSIRWSAWPLQPVVQAGKTVVPSLFQATASDVHPPAYLLMLHLWMRAFGTDLATLRLPSELAGIAAVPALYLLGSALYGRIAGLYAALLGAISPFWIWHAQEARMYSFLLLFTILGSYGLVVALEGGRRWGWPLFFLASLLAIYTQYFAFTVLAAQAVFVLMYRRHYGWGQLLAGASCLLLLALAYLPWLRMLLITPRGGSDPSLAAPTLYTPLIVLVQFVFGYLTVPLTSQVLAAWPLLVLGSLALSTFAAPAGRRGVLLWLLFGLPIALTFAVSLTVRPFLSERYLTVCSPPLYIMLAVVLTRAHGRLARAIVVGGTIAALLLAYAVAERNLANPMAEDYHSVVGAIETQARPGDAVLLDSFFNQDAFSYYAHDSLPIYGVPNSITGTATGNNLDPARVQASLRQIEAGRTRLWVLYYLEGNYDRQNIVRRYLDYHTSGHTVLIGGPYARNQPAYPGSYTNVQLVLYTLIPQALPAMQVRPPTLQQLRALTYLSPSLRRPFAPPFGPGGSGASLHDDPPALPLPGHDWHFDTLPGADRAMRLQLFNPNQRATLAQVEVLLAGRMARHSVRLPAASVVDLALSQWGGDAPAAALRIRAFDLIVPLRGLATSHRFRITYGLSGPGGGTAQPTLRLTLPARPARAGTTATMQITAAPDTLVHVTLHLPDGRSTSLYDLTDGHGGLRLSVRLPVDSAHGARATTARIVVQAAGAQLSRALPILPPDSRARSDGK